MWKCLFTNLASMIDAFGILEGIDIAVGKV